MACYEQALARKPDLVEAHLGVANVLQAGGRLDEAEERYARVLQVTARSRLGAFKPQPRATAPGRFRGWMAEP